ncbi:MAG: hypothetical protein NT092_15350 [Bacteroidia bacterium]|nr:hypothetical protein [Bacteroidia bacterium]
MKTIPLIALSLFVAAIIVACNNPSGATVAIQSQPSPKAIPTAGVVTSSVPAVTTKTSSVGKSTADNIMAAKNAGKAVFLVVTSTGATGTDKAIQIAHAANFINKNAVVIQMNKDDAANASLVNEYRLSGVPVPLILVISSKGLPTGGYILEQATAENVAALVPSPKLEEVYSAINSGKYAIVVFSKNTFTDRSEVLKECKKAVSTLGEAVLVEVDINDNNEANFFNQLRIDKTQLTASLTLVINKQGQVAGTATTIPDATKLVAAAKTPVAGGCGPGCGPAGCAK